MLKTELITKELKRISRKHKGILKPEIVVDVAKNENNILHDCFEWDDSKAGHEYRLWQARQIIRVTVEYSEATGKSFEVFVSLSSDRKESGYREVSDVIKDAHLRAIMLQDAVREMELFAAKYQGLKELIGVFDSIRNVKDKLESSDMIPEKEFKIFPNSSHIVT